MNVNENVRRSDWLPKEAISKSILYQKRPVMGRANMFAVVSGSFYL